MIHIEKLLFNISFAILLIAGFSYGKELVGGYVKKYTYKGVEYNFRYCSPCARFPNGFWLSETEVTLKMYKQFIEENPNYQSPTEVVGLMLPKRIPDNRLKGYSWRSVGFAQSDLHPVTLISARDAIAFCNWLSKRLEATIRLPFDDEWVYAASEGNEDIDALVISKENFFKYGNFRDKQCLKEWFIRQVGT